MNIPSINACFNWPNRFVVWPFKSYSLVFLFVSAPSHALIHRKIRVLDLNDQTRKRSEPMDDYAKDGGKELSTKMHCVRNTDL